MLPTFYLVLIPMIIVGVIGIFMYPNIGNPDHVAIQLAVDTMPVLVAGLLGAGTLAASMSSSEPCIHATALTYSKDVLQPVLKWNDEVAGRATRRLIFPIMVLIIAPISILQPASLVYILLIGYGFIAQAFPSIVGIFLWPRATKQGAFWGAVQWIYSHGHFLLCHRTSSGHSCRHLGTSCKWSDFRHRIIKDAACLQGNY